ncbi:inorganic phosphate cotransporter isoform X3 [Brachionus plicatilis]|uniref:Inorganic phosphate cotransporter isoform X3 n=1 Tax=Brachionus plicatilis TaxID=10195 RepID=A0A3M7PY64_BRAPC|nr:inorganic phosphate cotransporter isoform X3 [Brachionus plicatilis]
MESTKIPRLFPSVRLLMSLLIFLGYCFQYMLKINMSIAIVCMVNNTALGILSYQNSTELSDAPVLVPDECSSTISHHKPIDGPFTWPKNIQGVILSSYFYGYILTQLPGGFISYKLGGKNVLTVTMLIASIFTLLIPLFAKLGAVPLMICRFIVGLAHGAFWPSISSLWIFWAPSPERSRLVGSASAGSWVGNIVALPLGGYLCANGFAGGWGSIFYIFGIICFLWCVAFFFLTSDRPEHHKFISDEEKEYIVNETKSSQNNTNMKTPWKSILFSKACLAIYVAHVCSNWGIYLFLTQLPTFLKDVLKFDIKSNGLVSALPYIASSILNLSSSIISDKLITSGKLSRTNTRRLFGFIGLFVPLLSVIGLSFVTCKQPILGIALLVIGISFTCFKFFKS